MIVKVVQYQDNWSELYQKEKSALLNALGDILLNIHHIGSTAVKGLAAKPVIDIMIEVGALTKLDQVSARFEELGYEVMGELGMKGRRYYRKGGDERTHQIHGFMLGDAHVHRHIAFRDYLIAHPSVMDEYQALKIKLASTCNNDIELYCDGKDHFVKYHENQAINWLLR